MCKRITLPLFVTAFARVRGTLNMECNKYVEEEVVAGVRTTFPDKVVKRGVEFAKPSSASPLNEKRNSKQPADRNDRNTSDAAATAAGEENSKPYGCLFCTATFKKERELESHINEVVECTHCKTWFCELSAYSQHVQRLTESDIGKKLKTESVAVAAAAPDVGEEQLVTTRPTLIIRRRRLLRRCMQCDYCGKSYRDKTKLKSHIKAHLSATGDGDGIRIRRRDKSYSGEDFEWAAREGLRPPLHQEMTSAAAAAAASSEQNIYECELCEKRFSNVHSLKQHVTRHNREKCKRCDICGNNYTEEYFAVHSRIHTGEKPYACDICGKRFAQYSGLWEHEAVHSAEKPFVCTCGKLFSRRKELKRHAVLHVATTAGAGAAAGKGFIRCYYCGKIFGSKWLLQNHERKHTGERPFVCTVCSVAFTQKANLRAHLRTHSGEKAFSCEYCSRRFAAKGKLQSHVMIHTGEKPYVCTYCGKSFRQSATLRYHLRTQHLKQKPFECVCCGLRFTRKHFLVTHMANKHIEECDL